MNEVLAIKKLGGQVWGIANYATTTEASATAAAGTGAQHASEAEQLSIPEFWYDVHLSNNKAAGLGALQEKVKTMVQQELLLGVHGYATPPVKP